MTVRSAWKSSNFISRLQWEICEVPMVRRMFHGVRFYRDVITLARLAAPPMYDHKYCCVYPRGLPGWVDRRDWWLSRFWYYASPVFEANRSLPQRQYEAVWYWLLTALAHLVLLLFASRDGALLCIRAIYSRQGFVGGLAGDHYVHWWHDDRNSKYMTDFWQHNESDWMCIHFNSDLLHCVHEKTITLYTLP